jgi:hypothetical protein
VLAVTVKDMDAFAALKTQLFGMGEVRGGIKDRGHGRFLCCSEVTFSNADLV